MNTAKTISKLSLLELKSLNWMDKFSNDSNPGFSAEAMTNEIQILYNHLVKIRESITLDPAEDPATALAMAAYAAIAADFIMRTVDFSDVTNHHQSLRQMLPVTANHRYLPKKKEILGLITAFREAIEESCDDGYGYGVESIQPMVELSGMAGFALATQIRTGDTSSLSDILEYAFMLGAARGISEENHDRVPK